MAIKLFDIGATENAGAYDDTDTYTDGQPHMAIRGVRGQISTAATVTNDIVNFGFLGSAGFVSNPGLSSTDNAIVRWSGTGGVVIQDSGIFISDADNLRIAVDGSDPAPATGKLFFGAGNDVTIEYDGTNMLFDSQLIGTGDFLFSGGDLEVTDGELRISSDSKSLILGAVATDYTIQWNGSDV